MLIECFIKRDGPCIRTIHGIEYRFKPDKDGRLVCQVDRGEHASMMLAFPGEYREHKPGPPKNEDPGEIVRHSVEEEDSAHAAADDVANGKPQQKPGKQARPRRKRKA